MADLVRNRESPPFRMVRFVDADLGALRTRDKQSGHTGAKVRADNLQPKLSGDASDIDRHDYLGLGDLFRCFMIIVYPVSQKNGRGHIHVFDVM